MIEKTFLDRVPTYPGRVKMTPVPGQANTYDMVRADSPTVEGTPIDKAAFDSIIQSRLTGRYYTPAVNRAYVSTQSKITVNPIPTSGWSSGEYQSASGNYKAEANSTASSATRVMLAFDDSTSTRWASNSVTAAWLEIQLPSAIKLKKVKFAATRSATGGTLTATLKGSNNGTTWTTLLTLTQLSNNLTERELTNTGEFSRYRWEFNNTDAVTFEVYSWQFSEYDIVTYRNEYSLTDGMPPVWDNGQRITIETPATVNTIAVVSNTLNGVPINTILLPGKRYELRYTGSNFVAKEV